MDRPADPRVSVLRGVVLPERYQPIRRIASGGMASVWCALDRTLDRRVAIKLLAQPYAHDEVAGRRFTREARAAARLSSHQNVVTIYDVGRAAPSDESPLGRPFIVMEYLAGGTVADALRLGAVDRPTAVQWLKQAASALDYAHGRRVIHRDVKLANFLLDREHVLHVADFGIAQLGTEDTLTGTGQVLGTAGYLAPERALGRPATEASDRYALAVAAFELLVGERPFTAEHFAAQARQHVEEPPPLASRRNPALPPSLDPVLTRGMAKRPEERFGSAGELAAAIEQALSQPHSRRPAAVAVAGSAAVAAAGSAAASGAGSAALAGAGATLSTRALPAGKRALPGARGGFRGRIAALGALAAVALAVGVAAGANSSGGGSGRTAHTRSHDRSYAASRPTPPASRQLPATTRTAASAAPPKTATAPAPPQPTGADALEAQGYQLMVDGNYAAAIPVLRQAVAAAARSSLTYAYALYNLGHSLRLAGDPRAAVPILFQRLQIPNQTATVKAELTLALQELGQQVSGGAAPAPGGHHHGGAGPAPALDGQPPPAAQGD
jgi:eukaryotic-like serine/threonine-protein kinase